MLVSASGTFVQVLNDESCTSEGKWNCKHFGISNQFVGRMWGALCRD